ncbi:hypothetical protein LU604_10680 [Erwinia tracheiphila]|uniref:hypothetical protein n=1 Tax=Erwinia tracheiphila TaxID=65700 RepID=UPI001F2DB2D9|nr:hypothetical protein [Erwinia tracheiphila]UIA84677.1 hypothetical protein LU604_06980 [Erwinia tracheiphila]UIA85243.1 hypothetical protein LU604_10680 [Erwinia tracheiphila]UIA93269.1 hypothetical protein LU632_06955 [Erwinia tracheiphila]
MMEKYYVSGVKTDAKGHCEICDDDSANFYTLYERNESGESQGIIDLNFREDADAAMKVYVERNALQQQVNALAAEGAMMRQIIDSVTDLDNEPQYHYEGMGCGLEDRNITDRYEAMRHGWDQAMESVYGELIPCADQLDFSATDAAIREMMAQGVEKLAIHLRANGNDASPCNLIAIGAEDFAAQLRAGEVSK